MNSALAEIAQLYRIPCPAPGPVGLAVDGPNLWAGSGDTYRIYGIDARNGTVFEETVAPAKPYGMCVTGDALRVIIAAPETDDRSIHRYVFGKDFKSESIPCPVSREIRAIDCSAPAAPSFWPARAMSWAARS